MDIRCFIAVNLDDAIKEEIHGSTSGLRENRWDIKWVPAQNLHITLKFLGSVPEDSVNAISEKISLVSSSNEQFSIRLSGIGVFPDKKRPRVVWIDIIDSDALKKLQEEIEVSLATIGFERDKRSFSPHLTLGRLISLKEKDSFIREIEILKDRDFGNIEVNKILLMRGELKPTGAQYSALAGFPLNRRINDQ